MKEHLKHVKRNKFVLFSFHSYFYEDERGLFPECQFVYDLELPGDFTPVNADGEVAEFLLVSLEEVRSLSYSKIR